MKEAKKKKKTIIKKKKNWHHNNSNVRRADNDFKTPSKMFKVKEIHLPIQEMPRKRGGTIPGSRSPRVGNGNLLQYS